MKNYYRILEIDNRSTPEEIKTAYRKLAMEHHPDKGGDPDFFRDIQEAYDTLCDTGLREEYDHYRRCQPFEGDPYRTVATNVSQQPVDIFDDIVEVISRRFAFESDAVFDVDIILTPVEADSGINLELQVPIERICDRCFGFGGTILADCAKCGGIGMLHGQRIAHLSIRPGVSRGDTIVTRSNNMVIRGRIEIKG
jgi:DnaJ family protein A protein 2